LVEIINLSRYGTFSLLDFNMNKTGSIASMHRYQYHV